MKKHTQSSHQTKSSLTSGQGARYATPQKKSGGGVLMGLFAGLVIGVLFAFAVVLFLNKSPLPFQDKYEGAPKAIKDKATGLDGTSVPATPLPLPGKPGDKVKDAKQRFEFYGMLEGNQAATPQPNAAVGTAATTPASSSSTPPTTEAKLSNAEVYFLQAGAFQKAKDADNLKAKLALGGLDVSVQEVSIPEKGTMHRVRVGPYHTLEEMNQARGVLSQTGVQASVIKQKE